MSAYRSGSSIDSERCPPSGSCVGNRRCRLARQPIDPPPIDSTEIGQGLQVVPCEVPARRTEELVPARRHRGPVVELDDRLVVRDTLDTQSLFSSPRCAWGSTQGETPTHRRARYRGSVTSRLRQERLSMIDPTRRAEPRAQPRSRGGASRSASVGQNGRLLSPLLAPPPALEGYGHLRSRKLETPLEATDIPQVLRKSHEVINEGHRLR